MPVPAVARATLLGLGWTDGGTAEKVAWSIRFDFEAQPFILEDQKMGMNLYTFPPRDWTDAAVADFIDRAMAALQRAIRITETDVLVPAINEQLTKGNIILRNNVGSLRTSYRYLRRLAHQKIESPTEDNESDDVAARLTFSLRERFRRDAEQTALTDAMIVAFYAYLERYLTLALPFSSVDLASVDLGWFLRATWSEKFKQVLDLTVPEIKGLYDRLRYIADNNRNTRAHGHDKRGSTTGVFIDHVGVLPVMISGIEDTPDFEMGHYDEQRWADITSTFDEVDSLIWGPSLGNAGHWIGSAFDVRLFAEDVRNYRLPKGEYTRYFDREVWMWEREVNYEY